jgi:hypothetical protein
MKLGDVPSERVERPELEMLRCLAQQVDVE